MANKNDLGRSLTKDLLHHPHHPHNLHHPMLPTFNDHHKDEPPPLDFNPTSGQDMTSQHQPKAAAADLLRALSGPNQFSPGSSSNQLLQNLLSGIPGLPGLPGLSPIANSVAAAALAAALASSSNSNSNKDESNHSVKEQQQHAKIQSDHEATEADARLNGDDRTDHPSTDKRLDGAEAGSTVNLSTSGKFQSIFTLISKVLQS